MAQSVRAGLCTSGYRVAEGLIMGVTKWDRAEVNGVTLTADRLVGSREMKASAVMMCLGNSKLYDIYFGLVQGFYRHSATGHNASDI